MRERKEIEKEFNDRLIHKSIDGDIKVELLLDIRELLIKIELEM